MGSGNTRSSALNSLQAEFRIQTVRTVTFHTAVAARLGITAADLSCLNVLSLEGPRTPGELAARIGITRGGAVTAMLDRLETAGYVHRRRDTTDRRRVLVELDAARATELVSPLFQGMGAAVGARLAEYGDAELRLLRDMLAAVNEAAAEAIAELRDGR
ncbi:MarR family transcriptional regulator [Nocardia otitidiscaviarum]|uniref:MarR family winged helix-turn-helix transcriptional regulator n=1 Tax=Nocardia otitidiscaviarum TaxID=1823 RepID=UPI0018935F6E|nr:MarR family transcriptional regulator [Nocardia otitidiscaviarum]MBF6241494.1 MarR family transcriptional regulator [Nocardia otitidiscaviarum]